MKYFIDTHDRTKGSFPKEELTEQRPANCQSEENIDFDLDKVLENVGNLMSEKASAKGLELIFEVEPTVWTRFRGDPLRLGQILINFCNNAVKFTDKGEVAVQVRVLEDTADCQFVEFSVSDTGIGMSEPQIERLFQAFEQADASTTRSTAVRDSDWRSPSSSPS